MKTHSTHSNLKKNKPEVSSELNTQSEDAMSLRYLFMSELKRTYWAERAKVLLLPALIKNASTPELGEELADNLHVSNKHIAVLESIFSALRKRVETNKCYVMEGFLKETEAMLYEMPSGVVRDAAIISTEQKMQQFMITSYKSLIIFAYTLMEFKIASELENTTHEKKEISDNFTHIAQVIIIDAFEEIDGE